MLLLSVKYYNKYYILWIRVRVSNLERVKIDIITRVCRSESRIYYVAGEYRARAKLKRQSFVVS